MLAILPGNYSNVPEWLWIVLIVIVVAVAVGGAYLVIQGIFQGHETERWIDQDEPEYEDIWAPLSDAAKRYPEPSEADVKPMSVLDWLSKQNS